MKGISGIKSSMRGLVGEGASGLRRLTRDCSGAAVIFTALAFPLVLGTAALGLDASNWYMTKRQIQNIADLGAHAGAVERIAGGSKADAEAAIRGVAEMHGFQDGVDGTLVVNIPPSSGPRAGDSDFVEVIVQQQGGVYFASILVDAPLSIAARAVSGAGMRGDNCVLSLDPSADRAIDISGDANATFNCGLMANSTSDSAVYAGGTATLTSSDPVQAVGGILESGSGNISYTEASAASVTGASPVSDPYADLVVPTFEGSCAMGSGGNDVIQIEDGVSTLSEGFYCGTLKFNSDANVTLNPGVYVIYGGNLEVTAGAQLTGDSVTIILTAPDPADTGTVNIAGSSIVTLTAPGMDGHQSGDYIGEYAGVLFFQDPNAPLGVKNTFGGGASADLSGALYFPNQTVSFNGNSTVDTNCLQIVARQVQFTGSMAVGNDETTCDDLGVAQIGAEVARLFE